MAGSHISHCDPAAKVRVTSTPQQSQSPPTPAPVSPIQAALRKKRSKGRPHPVSNLPEELALT